MPITKMLTQNTLDFALSSADTSTKVTLSALGLSIVYVPWCKNINRFLIIFTFVICNKFLFRPLFVQFPEPHKTLAFLRHCFCFHNVRHSLHQILNKKLSQSVLLWQKQFYQKSCQLGSISVIILIVLLLSRGPVKIQK